MAEADRLAREYMKAVGDALELGILTYVPGTGTPNDFGPWWKSLGDLKDEIRAARGDITPAFETHLIEAFSRYED